MKVFDVTGTTAYVFPGNKTDSDMQSVENDCRRNVIPAMFADAAWYGIGDCSCDFIGNDPVLETDWIVTVVCDDEQQITDWVRNSAEVMKHSSRIYDVTDVTYDVGGADDFVAFWDSVCEEV